MRKNTLDGVVNLNRLLRAKLHGPLTAASIFACAASSLTQPAVAQTASIDEVLVSGKRIEQDLPQQLAEYGHRVQVIEAADLERRGITDVGQALQLMAPSLYVQSKSGPFDYVDVSLEGSRTNEVLWAVDGVRITNRLYNGTTPLDTIPASMVERIEILEGGQGLFYGTQSVAGVVNVITKAFSRERDGQVALGFDSNDGRRASGYTRGAVGVHQYVFYASSDKADGYQPIPTEDYQPSATHRKRGYKVQTLGAKYGVDLTDNIRLSAGYQHTNADLDIATAMRISQYYNRRQEGIANVKLDWAVSNSFGLYIKAYHHRWDSGVFRYENSLSKPGTIVEVNNDTFWGYKDYGINALAKFVPRPGGLEYYLGYDFQNYNGRDDALLIGDQTEKVQAVITQVRSGKLFEKVRLAAGVRYDSPRNGDAVTVWNVSGNYDITDALHLRASLGTAYRLPDAEQLYAIDPCCTFGNPKLSGERSTNLNVALGGTVGLGTKPMTWELVGYTRKVKDLIAGVKDANGNLFYGNTNGKTEVTGWLATVGVSPVESLSINLSYSATNATVQGSNLQIDRVPEDMAKVLIDFNPVGRPFGASLSFNHVGNTYQTLTGGLGRLNRGKADTADLSTYLQFGHEHGNRITARIQNITDEMYTTRLERDVVDGTSRRYAARLIGVPRTYSIMYSYDF
jgi:vitamin B12 transporter